MTTIPVSGALGTREVSEGFERLRAIVAAADDELAVDCSALTSIGLAGLQVLAAIAAAARARGQIVRWVALSAALTTVIDAAGFHAVFAESGAR